jgi:hypothetical protein
MRLFLIRKDLRQDKLQLKRTLKKHNFLRLLLQMREFKEIK